MGGAGEVWANLYPMNEHKLSECIVRLDPATGGVSTILTEKNDSWINLHDVLYSLDGGRATV